jgi:hypothetical protein
MELVVLRRDVDPGGHAVFTAAFKPSFASGETLKVSCGS